ncbi:hypothetical protein JAAARDRAFT_194223 [Jaapia argillacea MUCL 33604]|uniref:Uncharacterized protein n=1 Tax=Jaapia argillacea MUCL 33604 TaxID=933084 RepID=A0A067PT58_9AGAM|nr:hypothetical protein JAAARDRAFT_194223 [Jaapia argillacea MUCL 33604]
MPKRDQKKKPQRWRDFAPSKAVARRPRREPPSHEEPPPRRVPRAARHNYNDLLALYNPASRRSMSSGKPRCACCGAEIDFNRDGFLLITGGIVIAFIPERQGYGYFDRTQDTLGGYMRSWISSSSDYPQPLTSGFIEESDELVPDKTTIGGLSSSHLFWGSLGIIVVAVIIYYVT